MICLKDIKVGNFYYDSEVVHNDKKLLKVESIIRVENYYRLIFKFFNDKGIFENITYIVTVEDVKLGFGEFDFDKKYMR